MRQPFNITYVHKVEDKFDRVLKNTEKHASKTNSTNQDESVKKIMRPLSGSPELFDFDSDSLDFSPYF